MLMLSFYCLIRLSTCPIFFVAFSFRVSLFSFFFFICLYVCIYQIIFPYPPFSDNLSIYLSISISLLSVDIFFYLSNCPNISLSTSPSIYHPGYLSISLYVYLSHLSHAFTNNGICKGGAFRECIINICIICCHITAYHFHHTSHEFQINFH